MLPRKGELLNYRLPRVGKNWAGFIGLLKVEKGDIMEIGLIELVIAAILSAIVAVVTS